MAKLRNLSALRSDMTRDAGVGLRAMASRVGIAALVLSALVGAVASCAAEPDASDATGSPAAVPALDALGSFLKNGVSSGARGEPFFLRLGGRIHTDLAWMTEDPGVRATFGGLDDDAEFRRVRIYGAGRLWDTTDWKVEVDFAGDAPAVKDAYVGSAVVLPLAYLKVGHFKEPFGLEELTSSNHTTFMERALPGNAFAPSRNVGVQLSDHRLDARLTWAAGVFREVEGGIFSPSREAGLSRHGYGFTGRITGLPWCEADSARLGHLGFSFSYRDPGASHQTARFSTRPALHQAPRLVDSGKLPMDDAILACLEAAVVHGPWSCQGEYFLARVDQSDGLRRADFRGGYVQASYFLTGEHRPYQKPSGTFGRVLPRHDIGKGGPGALQLALRYDHVDLDDSGVRGGKAGQWTVGLNCYFCSHARVMFNYAHARVADAGRADLFGIRFQVDF